MQSREIIPAGSWMHLAAAFIQSYGLKFDGRTGYLDCGKEPRRIITDLTIQVGLRFRVPVRWAFSAGPAGRQQ